jgi:hypothetical protein
MKLERYPYYSDPSFIDFEFESVGRKGSIRKIARFHLINANLYSFGFGDLDETTGKINDIVVSNNGDGDKILATVAKIIHDFTFVFQDAAIFIEGSTPVRTRWYQMNINAYWADIGQLFDIYGSLSGEWEPFKSGVNYEAFLGKRKANSHK